MKRLGGLGLPVLGLLCAGLLIAWNGSRFIGAKQVIRSKDLSFLPTPTVARLLSVGHANTAAKLRWIDSFAYFQYQFDRRDDRLAGVGATEAGGFTRLYDTLIDLDPLFEPFYQHAALCTSGLLGQDQQALSYLMRGTLELPGNSGIWRQAVALLSASYQLEQRLPAQMDDMLRRWAEAVPEEQQFVWDWQRMMARRQYTGLEQLPVWLERMRATAPGGPTSEFIESVIREQLARFGISELEALAALHRESTGTAPLSLGALLSPSLVRRRHPQGLPPWSPVAVRDGRLVLLSDPFGYDYQLLDGAVVSQGLLHQRFNQLVRNFNAYLEQQETLSGKRISTPAELLALGAMPLDPPPGVRLTVEKHRLASESDVRPGPPWDLRAMLSNYESAGY